MNRGIRQGCPISALLFILVAEIIAISIRSEKNIKGITINEEEFKIIQLADDTTLFLKNIKSLVLAIDLFKKFGEFSGLKLNIEKTEIVPLGQLYLTTNSLPKRLKNNNTDKIVQNAWYLVFNQLKHQYRVELYRKVKDY